MSSNPYAPRQRYRRRGPFRAGPVQRLAASLRAVRRTGSFYEAGEKGVLLVIVEVVSGTDERPGVQVVDVDDLTRLHLALGAVTDEEADRALRDAGLGRLQDADTGVLDVAALRAAAEPQAGTDDWAQRWDGMVERAGTAGWLADDGATLQVHVESAAGA
jgi:hypothetical protein